MSTTNLRVIAPMQTNYFHCTHCEQMFMHAGISQQVHHAELAEYPDEVRRDSERLAEWLFELVDEHQDQLKIRVIDPLSLEGFWISVRHRIRCYPTFLLGNHKLSDGWDRETLERGLQEYLFAKLEDGDLDE